MSWVRAVFAVNKGQVIAVDGKSARHSYDKAKGKEAVHLVSAWATDNHLVLGQRAVDDKSNEITAIPELLRLLDVSGCIVTIDAMGCQTAIAEQIVTQQADYVLAVKGNQANLQEDMALGFRLAQQNNFHKVPHIYARTVNTTWSWLRAPAASAKTMPRRTWPPSNALPCPSSNRRELSNGAFRANASRRR